MLQGRTAFLWCCWGEGLGSQEPSPWYPNPAAVGSSQTKHLKKEIFFPDVWPVSSCLSQCSDWPIKALSDAWSFLCLCCQKVLLGTTSIEQLNVSGLQLNHSWKTSLISHSEHLLSRDVKPRARKLWQSSLPMIFPAAQARLCKNMDILTACVLSV